MKKEDLKTWSTDKLKDEAKALFSAICVSECYGVDDLLLYEWVLDELYSRGIEVGEDNIMFRKEKTGYQLVFTDPIAECMR